MTPNQEKYVGKVYKAAFWMTVAMWLITAGSIAFMIWWQPPDMRERVITGTMGAVICTFVVWILSIMTGFAIVMIPDRKEKDDE